MGLNTRNIRFTRSLAVATVSNSWHNMNRTWQILIKKARYLII